MHLQKTKIQNNAFSFPLWLSTPGSQYWNWKANKYSIRTEIEPELPVLEPSTRISTFYVPTVSEHQIHKAGIKTGILLHEMKYRSHN